MFACDFDVCGGLRVRTRGSIACKSYSVRRAMVVALILIRFILLHATKHHSCYRLLFDTTIAYHYLCGLGSERVCGCGLFAFAFSEIKFRVSHNNHIIIMYSDHRTRSAYRFSTFFSFLFCQLVRFDFIVAAHEIWYPISG